MTDIIQEIKRLKSSITDDQKKEMAKALGDETMVIFENILQSTDEDTAYIHLAKFRVALRSNILKTLKVYRKILTDEQRKIVEGFIDD